MWYCFHLICPSSVFDILVYKGKFNYLTTGGSEQKVGGRKKLTRFEIFNPKKVLNWPKRCKKIEKNENFMGGLKQLKFPESRFRASKSVLGLMIWYFVCSMFFFLK